MTPEVTQKAKGSFSEVDGLFNFQSLYHVIHVLELKPQSIAVKQRGQVGSLLTVDIHTENGHSI